MSPKVGIEEEFWGLYLRLLKFFRWRRVAEAEELAQETIFRGLRQILAGKEINADRYAYFLGIARNVLFEHYRKQKRELAGEPVEEERAVGDESDLRILLRECLEELPELERELVLSYHAETRSRVAKRHGLSPNALRIRVFRIQKKLRECLKRTR